MDLIKLSSATAHPTELSIGEDISGYTSALWVERYQEPGEFKIEGKLSSGLLELLPIKTFVTHMDTDVLMIVEDHYISEDEEEDATIAITGRCFTSYIENRILGDQELTNEVTDYVLASDQTWDQVVELIDAHLINPTNPNGALIGVDVNHTCSGTVTVEERTPQVSDVLNVIQGILKVDDLGLKAVRPSSTEPDIFYTVYRGNDVSTRVRFSKQAGDLGKVEYLKSSRKLKNRAFIKGRFVQATINPGTHINFDQRTMLVEAPNLDERQPSYPSNPARALIIAAMQITGDQQLKKQNEVTITNAEVSKNTKYRYRHDYGLGDLVTVDGNFGASDIFRVIEFAESVDAEGTKALPTLAVPGEY